MRLGVLNLNTVNLGFENKLWEMADKLRGNIESSEYKHVILGLVFLKYISDSFTERYSELILKKCYHIYKPFFLREE